MNDKQLLELPAKAAGFEIEEDEYRGVVVLSDCGTKWLPLADDGDALRLLCALPGCVLRVSGIAATVFLPRTPGAVGLKCDEYANEHGGSLNTAARRAIVRAAAEIGRQEACHDR